MGTPATFGTVSFFERGQGSGRGFAGRVARAELSQQLVPGGNAFVQIISDSAGAAQLAIPSQGSSAQLAALRGRIGQQDDLIFAGGTVTARLQSVASVTKLIDDLDLWRWTSNFLT